MIDNSDTCYEDWEKGDHVWLDWVRIRGTVVKTHCRIGDKINYLIVVDEDNLRLLVDGSNPKLIKICRAEEFKASRLE